MNRKLTNLVRFFMDDVLPASIRDSRWFMTPFYRACFRGYPNLDEIIDFKDRLASTTESELEQIYNKIYTHCRGPIISRPTDLNNASVDYILDSIPPSGDKIIDVGCGKGYFLRQVQQSKKFSEVHGCDLFENFSADGVIYRKANVQDLPCDDKSFDVVVCNHTLEHVRDCRRAINELKRITEKLLIITVPRQKFLKYTLDLHLHFFTRIYSCIFLPVRLSCLGWLRWTLNDVPTSMVIWFIWEL